MKNSERPEEMMKELEEMMKEFTECAPKVDESMFRQVTIPLGTVTIPREDVPKLWEALGELLRMYEERRGS